MPGLFSKISFQVNKNYRNEKQTGNRGCAPFPKYPIYISLSLQFDNKVT